jgi:hypothetical protein
MGFLTNSREQIWSEEHWKQEQLKFQRWGRKVPIEEQERIKKEHAQIAMDYDTRRG